MDVHVCSSQGLVPSASSPTNFVQDQAPQNAAKAQRKASEAINNNNNNIKYLQLLLLCEKNLR
jgi:hypothetical protein